MTFHQAKTLLIPYLRRYNKKRHIESRHLFKSYIERLDQNKYLTEKMISHIICFLKHDTKQTEDVLRKSLSVLTYSSNQDESNTSTLEEFFQ